MGLKHGTGQDKFASGDSNSGEYLDGKPHGKGTYSWATGQIYIGDFIKGLKFGRGKWRSSQNMNNKNCNTYEGEFKFDKKHGLGTFTWASGNTYTG